jgi:hypothetical protein
MARINTILLAIIAIAVVGWVARGFYQDHETKVAYEHERAAEIQADAEFEAKLKSAPPDPRFLQLPPNPEDQRLDAKGIK